MVLGPPGVFEPTKRLDARITLLASARPLKNRARVHFHQGTAEAIADVVLIAGNELAPGQSALAQLRLDQPVLLLPGDRFILRQFSPVVTIGGGTALDVQAARHKRADPSVAPFLETLERGNREEILAAFAEAAPQGLSLAQLTARTGWSDSEIQQIAKNLVAAKRVRIIGEQPLTIASAKVVAAYAASLRIALEKFHQANPLLPGIPKQDLRGRAGKTSAEIFDAALDDLVKAGIVSRLGRSRPTRWPRNRALCRRSESKRTYRKGIRARWSHGSKLCRCARKVAGRIEARAENSADAAARKSAHQGD